MHDFPIWGMCELQKVRLMFRLWASVCYQYDKSGLLAIPNKPGPTALFDL